MAKLHAFTFITLDGYYKGENEDINWHKHGEEEGEFSTESSGGNNIIVFGRKTYEMMYSFWPTDMAYDSFPVIADNMNKAEKLVISSSMQKAEWQNTSVCNSLDQLDEIKRNSRNDLTILGSGSIVNQLTDRKLIDEYMIMVDPVAIGKGNGLFEGIKENLDLELTHSRIFKSGVVLLHYSRAK